MGCNCGQGAQKLRYQVTLRSGTFPDGSTSKIYTTQSEANVTALKYPGAVVAALR